MNIKPVKRIVRDILIIMAFFIVCSLIPKDYFVYTTGMLVGFITTLGCGYTLRRYYRAKKYWVAKTGTVVAVNEDRGPNWTNNPRTDIYNPVIRFVTDAGEEMKVASKAGTSLSNYEQGTWVDIYYDPADPKEIILDDGSIGLFSLFFIAGLALIIVFNVLIVVHPEYLR